MDGEKNWVMNRIGKKKMNLLSTRLDRKKKHKQANYSNVSD